MTGILHSHACHAHQQLSLSADHARRRCKMLNTQGQGSAQPGSCTWGLKKPVIQKDLGRPEKSHLLS